MDTQKSVWPEKAKPILEKIGSALHLVFCAAYFAVTIAVAVMAISTYMARQDILAHLNQSIVTQQQVLAEGGGGEATEQHFLARLQIEAARIAARDVTFAAANGGIAPEIVTACLDKALDKSGPTNSSTVASPSVSILDVRSSYSECRKREEGDLNPKYFSWDNFLDFYIIFSFMSSQALIALIVITSCIIGATFAGLRDKSRGTFALRDILIGLGTGYVLWLALKGGRAVFLLNVDESATALNPYGMAFAGVIAGLFSLTAYELLSDLVEQLASRLRNAPPTV